MSTLDKRMAVALGLIGTFLVVAVCWNLLARGGSLGTTTNLASAGSWRQVTEGFLAVATPCCERASVWGALETVTPDGQRARAASLEEAAEWLDEWPYRSRDAEGSHDATPEVAALGSEVRCYGTRANGEVLNNDNDEKVLRALRLKRNCVYTKWKAWDEPTADGSERERHWVGVDGDGLFRGRVEYWYAN